MSCFWRVVSMNGDIGQIEALMDDAGLRVARVLETPLFPIVEVVLRD